MIGILIFTITALILGTLLVLTDNHFKKDDNKIEQYLPGYNCGVCGFGSCAGMKEAILENPENYKKCKLLKNKEAIEYFESLKNGFTLIELLSVIVIIGVIAVITVPKVKDSLESSQKQVAEVSVKEYTNSVDDYVLNNQMNNEKIKLDGIYNINNEGNLYNSLSEYEIKFDGDKPKNGILTYEGNELVSGCITVGKYKITIENGEITNTEKGDCEKDLQELISQKVDTYVKAALIANSSIEDAEAYTVSYMSDVTTNQPDSGWIHFKKIDSTVTIIDYSLTYGTITANYKSLTNGSYVSTFGDSRSKPIVIGSSVCYGPEGSKECFKVISTNSSITVLLADDNLKKDTTTNPITYKQDKNSPDIMSFAPTNYWMDNDTLVSTYSNNGEYSYNSGLNKFVDENNVQVYPYIYDSNSNTSEYIEGYLDVLKTATYGLPSTATGRLLTYDEANTLNSNIKNNGYVHWIGSASSNNRVHFSNGSGIGYYTCTPTSYGTSYVRPVIVISTSDFIN